MQLYNYLQPGLHNEDSVILMEDNLIKFKSYIGCNTVNAKTFDGLYHMLFDGIGETMTNDILHRNVEPFIVMLYKNGGKVANTITPYATKPHEQYRIDLTFDNGFDITTLDYLKECMSDEYREDIDLGAMGRGGIHDDRFGPYLKIGRNQVDFTYSCGCGSVYGIANLGEECIDCGQKVKRREFPLSKRGWISMPSNMLMPTYRGMVYLTSMFGNEDMSFILGDIKTIDENRKKTDPNSSKDNQTKGKAVDKVMQKVLKAGGDFFDCCIGVYESDLKMGYKSENARKAKAILENNKDTFFSNRFPVISTALRKSYASKKKVSGTAEISLCELDKAYIKVLDASISCNKKMHTRVVKNLTLSNYRCAILGAMEVYELIIIDTGAKDPNKSSDAAKKKHIQAQTFSRRQRNTIMTVMTVMETFTMSNGIGVSYRQFITLYYDRLREFINDPIRAKRLLNTNIDPKRISDETKKICEKFLKLYTCPAVINRQPTLTRGSNVSCFIEELHIDEVIKLPPIIYSSLNADVDGDKPSIKGVNMQVYCAISTIFSPCDGALDNYGFPTKQNRIAREFSLNALLITGSEDD